MAERLSSEIIAQVKEYGEAGFTYSDIAKDLGISDKTVGYILGPKRPHGSPHKVTEETIQQMLKLRGKGLSNSQIALELGINAITVRRHIGKQADMSRAAYGSIVAKVCGESFVKEEERMEQPLARKLKLAKTEVTMDGDIASYKLSSEGRTRITFKNGTQYIDLTKQDFLALIAELCEAGEWMTHYATDQKEQHQKRLDGTYISAISQ